MNIDFEKADRELEQSFRLVLPFDELADVTPSNLEFHESRWRILFSVFCPFDVYFNEDMKICLVNFKSFPGVERGTRISFMATDQDDVIVKLTKITYAPQFDIKHFINMNDSLKEKIWEGLTRFDKSRIERQEAEKVG
jgi:hypothetical protein